MKTRFLLPLACLAAFSLNAMAAPRVFTDVDGRKIEAELLGVTETTVKLRLRNGKEADIGMARLSLPDQMFVETWAAANEKSASDAAKAAAAAKRAAEIPLKLVAYCQEQMGKQVGNGECWTLADEAFKACGLQRPGGDLRVWGRLVDYKKEKLQPGDIVEYRSAVFTGGSRTGPEHTSIIVKVERKNVATIAHQNWSGHKTVAEAPFIPENLESGEVMVYRPL